MKGNNNCFKQTNDMSSNWIISWVLSLREENKEGNNWYKIIFKRFIESNTSDSMNFSEFYNVKLHYRKPRIKM